MISGKCSKRYWLIVGCFVLVAAIICCAVIVDDRIGSYNSDKSFYGECNITLNQIGEVTLVNEVIEKWLAEPGDVSTVEKLYEQYREYGRLDYPNPVVIGFSVNNVPIDAKIVKQKIAVSEKEDFSDAVYIDVPNHQKQAEIYNLKTGMTYYYKVTVSLSDGTELQQDSSFKTANTQRYLYIDGVRNVRDIGGYRTLDGKTVSQGMIYRGTELDGAISEGKFVITDKGIDTMVNELGIKLEMDLRASNLANSKDMLPPQVSHKYYTAFYYLETFDSHGRKSLKKIFSDLANPDNYPIYMHCTYGNDRTGTIAYLMGAVLGMDEQSLYNEWALSSFFSGSSFSDKMTDFVTTIKSYKGDTLQEKVSNYLLSIGVKKSELDSFRRIMLVQE